MKSSCFFYEHRIRARFGIIKQQGAVSRMLRQQLNLLSTALSLSIASLSITSRKKKAHYNFSLLFLKQKIFKKGWIQMAATSEKASRSFFEMRALHDKNNLDVLRPRLGRDPGHLHFVAGHDITVI